MYFVIFFSLAVCIHIVFYSVILVSYVYTLNAYAIRFYNRKAEMNYYYYYPREISQAGLR